MQKVKRRLNGVRRTSAHTGTLHRDTMPIGDPKYTSAQRDAIELHYVDRNRIAREVAADAAAGRLTDRRGDTLEPFDIPINTVRDMGRKVRKRRAGKVASPLADKPARDAVETLRRRLVNLADRELGALEQQKAGTVDPERLRQVARAVLEVSRLPGPTDPRPNPATTKNPDGKKTETRGGLAGPLLAAHRAGTLAPAPVQTGGTAPAQDAPHNDKEHGEGSERSAATHAQPTVQTGEQHHEPGEWARKQSERVSRAGM